MSLLEGYSESMTTNIPQETLVEVKNIKKLFPVRRGLFTRSHKRQFVHAVEGVNIAIRKGEVLSLVGESGCGKTTLARLILRLLDRTEGTILFDGQDLFAASGRNM